MYALCFYLTISELDSSYLDQHVLLLVWGVPSLMHHGSQLRSLKTTDWLLTALWLQTFWFHQVNKVIPLYISSYRILPQHLGSHALRFHEYKISFETSQSLSLSLGRLWLYGLYVVLSNDPATYFINTATLQIYTTRLRWNSSHS